MACCCWTLLAVAGVVIITVILALVKVYLKLSAGWCRSPLRLVGKVAVVTGANSGIGFQTALDFAKRGAKVIIGCRNRDLGEKARNKIISLTKNENIVLELIDLNSLKSVKEFASRIKSSEQRLDILVNNAGAGGLADTKSEDGYQILMQINYLAPVLLIHELLDLLKKTPGSRIVNLTSVVAKYVNPTEEELNNLNYYPGETRQYCLTKLYIVYFTKQLAEKLKQDNLTVTVNAVHPGVVATNLFRNMPKFMKMMMDCGNIFYKTPLEGAQTSLHVALDKSVAAVSGRYFSDCKAERNFFESHNDKSKILWNNTQKLLKINF